MPRLYGYAPKGERCFGQKKWCEKGRTNVIGALINAALLTTCLISGTVNSDVFHAWVVQDLLPKLPQNAVIVMDNATFHKRKDTQQAIENAGHTLEYLPPYSPDLNPIENKWSSIKAYRRKTQCSIEKLFQNESFYMR